MSRREVPAHTVIECDRCHREMTVSGAGVRVHVTKGFAVDDVTDPVMDLDLCKNCHGHLEQWCGIPASRDVKAGP